MKTKQLGGDRLGSGNKMNVDFKTFDRSTHNEGYVWTSTASAGTLIPFLSKLLLTGETMDIDLNCDILTHPTVGPLFGSYKVQLDIFKVPVRLYNAHLHMNELDIGLKMNTVYFPQIEIEGPNPDVTKNLDNQQINSSCILKYLKIRGIGIEKRQTITGTVNRKFNCTSWLAYWDIFKNYYANKQEENAYVIHNDLTGNFFEIGTSDINGQVIPNLGDEVPIDGEAKFLAQSNPVMTVLGTASPGQFEPSRLFIYYNFGGRGDYIANGTEFFYNWSYNADIQSWIGTEFANPKNVDDSLEYTVIGYKYDTEVRVFEDIEPRLVEFPLKNIDNMKKEILKTFDEPFVVDSDTTLTPYSYLLESNKNNPDQNYYSTQSNQEGLAVKTYQADMFNNWVNTDWIEGTGGINEISAINVEGTEFGELTVQVDEVNLKSKIHKMLMRIGVSGGSYNDWQEAVFNSETLRVSLSPIYEGGLIKELAFQSVISNAETDTQPLGTLGGRGTLTGKHKGGKVKVRAKEICYVIGIFSLTPRVNYSQGNGFDTNYKTLDDVHKPDLDRIGFQDLITDKLAWFDTYIGDNDTVIYRKAGKQPAWIDYMSSVNETFGNFANENDMMFMTLNRRYEPSSRELSNGGQNVTIKDLTTYIDPKKYNHIFAYTRRDAQNFWVQINVGLTSRRVMSSKVMPVL